MAHEDTRIVPYLRGELSPLEKPSVEAHLASCTECRATAEDFRATPPEAGPALPSAA